MTEKVQKEFQMQMGTTLSGSQKIKENFDLRTELCESNHFRPAPSDSRAERIETQPENQDSSN